MLNLIVLPRWNLGAITRGHCAVQVVWSGVGFVARLLNSPRETRHPFVLIFGWGGKQKHVASAVGIVMKFARSQRIVGVDVIFVYLDSAPVEFINKNFWFSGGESTDDDLPFTFVSSWRSKHVPQWLRTHFASGWHVIADLHEFMAFENRITGSQIVLWHVKILFVWPSSLAFASIEQLKDSGDFFGIGTNDVALGDRPYVKHFATS